MGGYVYCAGNPVKLVDPDGRLPLPVVTGIAGGVLGAVTNTCFALNNGCSAKEVAGAALNGLVTGAVAGACLGAGINVPLTAVISGAASGTGTVIEQSVASDHVNPIDVGVSVVVGGVLSAVGGTVSSALKKSFVDGVKRNLASKSVQKSLENQTRKELKSTATKKVSNAMVSKKVQSRVESEIVNSKVVSEIAGGTAEISIEGGAANLVLPSLTPIISKSIEEHQ